MLQLINDPIAMMSLTCENLAFFVFLREEVPQHLIKCPLASILQARILINSYLQRFLLFVKHEMNCKKSFNPSAIVQNSMKILWYFWELCSNFLLDLSSPQYSVGGEEPFIKAVRSSYALLGFKGKTKMSWTTQRAFRPGRGPATISAQISKYYLLG